MAARIQVLSERPLGRRESFPMMWMCEGREFCFSSGSEENPDWKKEILEIGKKRGRVECSFFSSQEMFVFKRIHEVLDAYIPDLSLKVDPLLRELVKNAEKQNVLSLASEVGLIPHADSSLSMDMMGKILREQVIDEESGQPLLYRNRSRVVRVVIVAENNELTVQVRNMDVLGERKQKLIANKIQLGKKIAHFDLRQEFEMKSYPACKPLIEEFLAYEYTPQEREKLWPMVFDEDFDEYWMMSPYFLLMAAGTHSSFFPYYATVYEQLRVAQKQSHHIEEGHYSAGLGYIQSAFIIESNRSLYGTAGEIFVPFDESGEVVAGFRIGFPSIDIMFS